MAHAHPDVHVRGRRESKRLAYGFQVDRLHVEDLLEGVGLVGADVSLEGLLGRDVEEVILRYQFFQLEETNKQIRITNLRSCFFWFSHDFLGSSLSQ